MKIHIKLIIITFSFIFTILADTVNCISFTPDASHVITGSSDGTMSIIRCGNWITEKHFPTPHKGMSVDNIAVHPSGKIAMTTGHDGVLRTWNLIKGRQAYATNLIPDWKHYANHISALKWSPSGNSFLIAADNKLEIYSVETAGLEKELSFQGSKISCVEYLNDQGFAIGFDDGKITTYDILHKTMMTNDAHNTRVKSMAVNGKFLVSGSSSGEIKLWSFNNIDEFFRMHFLNEVNCSCRISCLTLTTCLHLKQKENDINVETKLPKKVKNKLRLKRQVIIQEEDKDLEEIKSSKSKNKRKVNEAFEEVKDKQTSQKNDKKIKLNSQGEKRLKKKIDVVDVGSAETTKKKRKFDGSIKRKETSESLDNISRNKKIKTNNVAETKKSDKNVRTVKNKKKRKVSGENEIGNYIKKQKKMHNIENSVVSKKKKKKNIKRKVS